MANPYDINTYIKATPITDTPVTRITLFNIPSAEHQAIATKLYDTIVSAVAKAGRP